jgi:hypothetical protein
MNDKTFGIGPGGGGPNNGDQIAYAWVETPDVSSFGSYNGSNSSTSVDCGFEPAFVMVKCSDNTGNWVMWDSARGGLVNLQADNNLAEGALLDITFTDTGFTINTVADIINQTGRTYIYAAFAGDDSNGTVVSTDLAANQMVVDGGKWVAPNSLNQSQEWSSTQTFPWGDSTSGIGIAENAFDGDLTTFGGGLVGQSTAGTVTFTGLDNITSFRLYYFTGTGTGGDWSVFYNDTNTQVNVSALHPNPGGEETAQWVDLTSSFPNNFELLTIQNGQNAKGGLMAVEVNGKLLVDASATPPGKTEVTGSKKSGVATFVSTNGTDTMTVENSNLEFITNDNRLGEEFFIKKLVTALNANDPAHVEVQKAVNEAFEAFPKNVQARKAQIAKTFTKLVAGAAITKAELNALRVVVEAASDEKD